MQTLWGHLPTTAFMVSVNVWPRKHTRTLLTRGKKFSPNISHAPPVALLSRSAIHRRDSLACLWCGRGAAGETFVCMCWDPSPGLALTCHRSTGYVTPLFTFDSNSGKSPYPGDIFMANFAGKEKCWKVKESNLYRDFFFSNWRWGFHVNDIQKPILGSYP